MSDTLIDPEPRTPTPELHLREIARELAELLEMGRQDDESWSLDFWRFDGSPKPFISFTIRTGTGHPDWSIQSRVDPRRVQMIRMPFLHLRREVELAYQKLRDRQ